MNRLANRLLDLRYAMEASRIQVSVEGGNEGFWTVTVYWTPPEGSDLPEEFSVLGTGNSIRKAVANAERRVRRLLVKRSPA